MNSKRNARAGANPARVFTMIGGAAAAAMLAAAPVSASAKAPSGSVPASLVAAVSAGQNVSDFYRARSGRPLWTASPGAAEELIELLASAEVDGLNRKRYPTRKLAGAVRAARNGDARAVKRAETMLSEAFVAYARDLRRPANVGMIWVDREAIPAAPQPRALLQAAAAAPSLQGYVHDMGWMNPYYAPLRRALAGRAYASEEQRRLLAINLERARALPGGGSRYVVVNAAAQRLEMYQAGRLADSMKVVVGKPKYPTPMMGAMIRFASLNPYWFVPPDLAAERIAPNVLKQGMKYLDRQGYEVVNDFVPNPRIVDPSIIDWKAVAEGRMNVLIRQKPGRYNAMGRMKFMFPNEQGIYLHDTPEKELLTEASRLFSGGCVRLEDAPRLGRWLFGRELDPTGAKAEQQVRLPKPVPVYITYLTAVPSGSSIAYFDDVYGRDAARLAGRTAVASR